MLSIRDGPSFALALASPIDIRLKRLLQIRSDQLSEKIADRVHFAIVQPGDPPDAVEAIIGLPLHEMTGYAPDWVQEHDCAFELVFDLTEEFTQVIMIPKLEGIDRELLSYATAITTQHA
jgi:hypothetical protein